MESGGYGPIRRKDESKMDIVLEPCEMEGMEIVSDGEDAPYDKPQFDKVKIDKEKRKELRRIVVPNHRFSPLKNAWKELLEPLVDQLKLQIRMNTKRRAVELRLSENTPEVGYLQKGADFVKAFMMGFEVRDAVALLRLDDIFVESFEVKDVKRLQHDHLSRCIGRLAGKDGKTKYAIENSTRTRIVIAESKIHILGAFGNIKQARDALCALILGSDPGKVYNRLKTVSKRVSERV